MESRTGGGAQRLWRIGAGGAGDARGGSGTAGRAKSRRRTQDCADIARVLHAGKDDKQSGASRFRGADQVVERSLPRFYQGRYALRMLSVGQTLEEAVSSSQRGKAYFRAVDEGREALVMALAGFAEQQGLDPAAGAERFFDQAHAFYAHKAIFRGQAAAEGHAKLFEPAIVAAGEQRGFAGRSRVSCRLARRSHSLEVSKFQPAGANASR